MIKKPTRLRRHKQRAGCFHTSGKSFEPFKMSKMMPEYNQYLRVMFVPGTGLGSFAVSEQRSWQGFCEIISMTSIPNISRGKL